MVGGAGVPEEGDAWPTARVSADASSTFRSESADFFLVRFFLAAVSYGVSVVKEFFVKNIDNTCFFITWIF